MDNYTPGPWFVDWDVPHGEIGYRAIVDVNGLTVAKPSPMGEANAKLIAAAPDLLFALTRLVDTSMYGNAAERDAAVVYASNVINKTI